MKIQIKISKNKKKQEKKLLCKSKNEREKIIEKCKEKLGEKENNIKLLSNKISLYQNNENENQYKLKQLSLIIDTYKKQFNEYEEKIKLLEEKSQNYSNLEKQYINLKNKLDEYDNKNKKNNELIKTYEIQISQLNQKYNNNISENKEINKIENEFNKKLEIIKEKYELLMKENINKTTKKLLKFVGDNLSKTKKKYDDFYKQRELSMNSKFDEIKKLIKSSDSKIKNIINLEDNKNVEIKNSVYEFDLDDEVNNLSKTHIFSKKNLYNIDHNLDNINDDNKKEEIKNEIKTITNSFQTPKGPDNSINEDKFKIENKVNTPTGNGNENIINDNYQSNNEYSFDCTNAMYLTSYIYQGTDEIKLELIIKNNGNKEWPEKARFKILKSSEITADDIILNHQKPEEKKSYFVTFKNLKNYSVGEYKSTLVFCVGEKIYGEKLIVRIKIKEKNETNNKIKENMEKINEFRETFSLSENDYSNEKLFDILQENDFNYEQAFSSLFD